MRSTKGGMRRYSSTDESSLRTRRNLMERRMRAILSGFSARITRSAFVFAFSSSMSTCEHFLEKRDTEAARVRTEIWAK
eukprot:2081326-Rhodomonas_salina.3